MEEDNRVMHASTGRLLRAARAFDRITGEVILIVILLIMIFILSSITDIYSFTARGIHGVKYRSVKELMEINPDTVGWLSLEGTQINGPVVQGKDNFEYLDLDFYGHYYAGGTLFLDKDNSRDLSDEFNVIHGHHMAGGAMFGDLHKFTENEFFRKHGAGELILPDRKLKLRVIASGMADAKDTKVYSVKGDISSHLEVIRENAVLKKKFDVSDGNILMLSTCTGDINDTRTIVFCQIMNKGA